jgi:hypothetical protein
VRGLAGCLAAAMLVLAHTPAAMSADDTVRAFGDVRLVFFANERDARDRTLTKNEGLRMRLRAGAEGRISEDWLIRGRLAGRYSTDQDRMRYWFKSWAPTNTGLEDGDTTIDELYLRYAPSAADWSLRVGRFQSVFKLDDVTGKSLDRRDSSNVSVNWTDGVHLQYALTPAWRTHLILQYNDRDGTGSVARAPLDFSASGSRVTTFAGLESTARVGPVKQRMIGVTWIPDALATEGVGESRRDDYVALTARGTAEWPIEDSDMRGVIGVEFGYAPNTPRREVMNAGEGRSGGWAKQFSMNLLDFVPRHDIGFAYGSIDPGWLISANFRANELLLEGRYRWRMREDLTMEVRLRRREERYLPEGVGRPRIDDDAYLRFTRRF